MRKSEYTPDAGLDLESVIKKYYDAVRSNALHSTRSESAAADITQDVFVLLCERWDTLKRDRVGGWIFSVLYRKLREYFRKTSRENAVISLDDTQASEIAPSVEDVYFETDDDEIEAVRERVLSVLSDEERKLYEACFVEGRSYEDVCAVYSLSYAAATSRVKRLRRKLEKSIKKNGKDILPILTAAATSAILTQIIFNGRWDV